MDARYFDALTRFLSVANTRRRLVAALAALPLVASLSQLLDASDVLAGRRKRRKQRHRKRKNPGSRKRGCRAKSRAKICAGRCGRVKNRKTCGKKVNCGPCSCTPACGDLTCCSSNVCADLQSDPANCGACGHACGDGQVCQGGVCGVTCEDNFCAATSHVCSGARCQTCNVICQSPDHTCDMALLQAAMETDSNLYVCPGLYTGNLDIPAEMFVAITGAGMGDDPRSQTILDAQGSGRVVSIGESAIVHLRAVRIRNGTACGGSGVATGNDANLELAQCAVVENGNDQCQGGALSTAGDTNLFDCLISSNHALDGGGLAVAGGSVKVYRSEIRDNTASTSGGGISVTAGELELLEGAVVTENTSETAASGGGIAALAATNVTISADSQVTGNNPDDCQIAGTLVGTCG